MKIGIDIGGTKCAVVLGDEKSIRKKVAFPTTDLKNTLDRIINAVEEIGIGDAIGISCGGPLDEEAGLILSPPNLPGWDRVPIKQLLSDRFGIPVFLCNDANACALAEWRYGAGKGTQNMIFLTFGTGLGAGLILDGHLYRGTNGMAGEVGHIRMCEKGPVGYGKVGSLEGFCSGGGIAGIARKFAQDAIRAGNPLPFCPTSDKLNIIDAKTIAQYADAGEPTSLEIFRISAEMLGRGLAVLVDLLNPEVIVIGSIFQRAEKFFRKEMERYLQQEALPRSLSVCRVLPAELKDEIGDYAALAVAFQEGGK